MTLCTKHLHDTGNQCLISIKLHLISFSVSSCWLHINQSNGLISGKWCHNALPHLPTWNHRPYYPDKSHNKLNKDILQHWHHFYYPEFFHNNLTWPGKLQTPVTTFKGRVFPAHWSSVQEKQICLNVYHDIVNILTQHVYPHTWP
jgi:hypothetical protein